MNPGEFLDSLAKAPGHASALASLVLDLARNRLELARIEIVEAQRRLAGLLFLAVVAALLFAAALCLAAVALVYALPPEHRVAVLAAAAAIMGVLALVALLWFKSALKRLTPPFEDLLGELKKDKELL